MFDLMQLLTSSMASFGTPLESYSSSFLEISVLGEKALNLKKVLSHAAVELQKSLSDLVKLKRKESQHQSQEQHSLILL